VRQYKLKQAMIKLVETFHRSNAEYKFLKMRAEVVYFRSKGNGLLEMQCSY